jgi:Flp pilus assembly protein TadG
MVCLPCDRVPAGPGETDLAGRKPIGGGLIGKLLRCTRGGPIIEFAMVAPAAIALLLAVLHVALIYLAQEGLETAAETSARLIMTGQAQQSAMSQSDFKAAACKALPPFLTCDHLYVDGHHHQLFLRDHQRAHAQLQQQRFGHQFVFLYTWFLERHRQQHADRGAAAGVSVAGGDRPAGVQPGRSAQWQPHTAGHLGADDGELLMRLRAFLQRLRLAREGTSLVEFTIVLPTMLVLYLLAYTLCDALACSRKVTITTRELTDLPAAT